MVASKNSKLTVVSNSSLLSSAKCVITTSERSSRIAVDTTDVSMISAHVIAQRGYGKWTGQFCDLQEYDVCMDLVVLNTDERNVFIIQ